MGAEFVEPLMHDALGTAEKILSTYAVAGAITFHAVKMGVNFHRFGDFVPCFSGVEKVLDNYSDCPQFTTSFSYCCSFEGKGQYFHSKFRKVGGYDGVAGRGFVFSR